MNILLDTHILIWALTGSDRLPKMAREMILSSENSIYYSVVSIWEVSIKHANHPDNVTFSGEELNSFCEQAGFLPLELKNTHVFSLETIKRSENAPKHHDPFDRILIAQAKAERMMFLTHDHLLPYYNEKCIVITS